MVCSIGYVRLSDEGVVRLAGQPNKYKRFHGSFYSAKNESNSCFYLSLGRMGVNFQ